MHRGERERERDRERERGRERATSSEVGLNVTVTYRCSWLGIYKFGGSTVNGFLLAARARAAAVALLLPCAGAGGGADVVEEVTEGTTVLVSRPPVVLVDVAEEAPGTVFL